MTSLSTVSRNWKVASLPCRDASHQSAARAHSVQYDAKWGTVDKVDAWCMAECTAECGCVPSGCMKHMQLAVAATSQLPELVAYSVMWGIPL